MGRGRGSGQSGPTRSLRLPLPLDAWFEERLMRENHRSVSDILVELVHGGLRLRHGYMAIHRRALEERLGADPAGYATYRACLLDSFGAQYVEHIERWLEADGVLKPIVA